MREALKASQHRLTESETTKDEVALIGLDFGSTTSSALAARARIARHPVSGKIELAEPRVVYRSEPIFTPFLGESIDAKTLMSSLDQWLKESGLAIAELFAGGTIITGLAARRDNARSIADMVRSRLGETLIATADDPRLESWLAFMGSCATLSRLHATRNFINLDIGGGTTNPAWGCNGEVLDTACYFIGARHFEVEPGTYRLVRISEFGRALLNALQLDASVGDTLTAKMLDLILGYYVKALEAIVIDDTIFFENGVGRTHEQVRCTVNHAAPPTILFSGGVGEIIYRLRAGVAPEFSTTQFGDLGIDLAKRVLDSPLLSRDLSRHVPDQRGRATVYGLALHSTEVSGRTIFLSRENLLPMNDVRIVARIAVDASDAEVDRAVAAASALAPRACIQLLPVSGTTPDWSASQWAERLKRFATRLGEQWHERFHHKERVLLLLTSGNDGKSIGNYATRWRALPMNLIVIDEIPDRHAQFVNIGKPHDDVIPVSFYGLH